MATQVRPTREHQRQVREETRAVRPPGWSPDGHRGPGDWMAIAITLAIIAFVLIVAGISFFGTDAPEMVVGDAYELEQLGSFTPLVSPIVVQGDAFELERLGTFTYQFVDVAAPQGDALELERLGTPVVLGDASELEALGAWTFKISDIAAAQGDAAELEALDSFTPVFVESATPGDAYELERLP